MKETLKSLNIGVKVLNRRSNNMRDAAKSLAGNILTTKSVKFQIEYMGKIKVTLRGVRQEGPLGFFLFGEVDDVSSGKSKAGIATRRY